MHPPKTSHKTVDKANGKLWLKRFSADFKVSEKNALSNLSIAEQAGYPKGAAIARLNLAYIYFLCSRNDAALKYINEALAWLKENEGGLGFLRAILLLGNIYESFGDYERTLSLWLEALNISRRIPDAESEAEACNQLGLVYFRLSNYKKALDYFNSSLKLRQEFGDENATASTLNRIGMVLRKMKRYEESLGYYFRSLEIRQRNKQASAIPWTLLGIASTHEESGNPGEAMEYYLRGNSAGDPRCRLQCRMGAGRMLSLKGSMMNEKIFSDEAEKMLKESLAAARELKALSLVAEAYFSLAGHYELSKSYDKALESYRMYQESREALLNEEAQSRLRNVEISHAVEKSEQEKEIFRLRNVELKKAYDIIEEKNIDITSSINYASRIQSAILPKPSDIKTSGKNLFILYIPKDIVSGDFYWFTLVDKKLVLVAGDCTGHGVPGALMSMLGISLLNELVNNRRISDPALILEELGNGLKRSLHQVGGNAETKDGMDMSVCIIDRRKGLINYAGANNNLYLVREGQMHEFKADRLPVGYNYDTDEKFTSQEIITRKGDMIYMISDGFADQFGGPNQKKYKYSALRETFLSIHNLPLNMQKKKLAAEFHSWKGTHEQIDDVLVLGYRI